MVDLKLDPNQGSESSNTPKKLVLGEIKDEKAPEAKIEDSPKKRWKIFALIGGIVALVIAISVASNWEYITKNFRGFTLIELKTEPKDLQEQKPLNLPPGTVTYDAYQAADGSVYLKVPFWNCEAGEVPNSNKTGKAGVSGECDPIPYDSGHPDYSLLVAPNSYWDCPDGFEKEDIGECVKPPEKVVGSGSVSGDVVVGTTKPPVTETDCPAGTVKVPKAKPGLFGCIEQTAAEEADSGASKPGALECPEGKIAVEISPDKWECVPNKFGDPIVVTLPDEIPVIVGTTKKPDVEGDDATIDCPAGTFYDDVKKACMSNLVLACPNLEAKVKTYEEALSTENKKGKSAIEIEMLEFLFTKAVQEALEEDCNVDNDYEEAAECNAQESFDIKTEACKSAPGYEKIGDNQDEYDCDEIDAAIAAIDTQLAVDDLNNTEKSYLGTLKLNLVTGKNSCQTGDNNGGGSSGGGGGSSGGGGGSSGGGGGGGGAPSSSKKNFEIKNVQVKPEEFNPFSENVKVYFFITADAYVSLQVLDGKEVIHTVKEEKMNAGDRSFSWDGKKDKGGFVSEKDYTLKIIAKKANNKANKVEEEIDVSVKYFDEGVDLPKDPSFEGDSGTVKFTSASGSGSGSGSSSGSSGSGSGNGSNGAGFGSNGAANYAQSHGSASPLAQKIYGEGSGKAKTSETGPETILYTILVITSVAIACRRKQKKATD